MDKETILSYFNESLINQGYFYTYQNIPSQIGQAIYLYGNSKIFDITAFIDCSPDKDGSIGIIITHEDIYFQLNQKGHIHFQDVQSLSIEKHRYQDIKGIIETKEQKYVIDNMYLHVESFINALSDLLDIDISMIMTKHEKIEYNIITVLRDIENDEYEDVELTTHQKQQIQEFYENISIIQSMDDENYQFELETLVHQALAFFDELELDSDEIDELIQIEDELNKKEEQVFENAQKYYDDMMHQYQNGDTKMLNQMKNMMKMLGIDENELRNKSPEELNQYIEDLCARFGISKKQVDQIMKNFHKG